MEKMLLNPSDMNNFHAAIQNFLKQKGYQPIVTSISAVTSSRPDMLRTVIPKLCQNATTVFVDGKVYREYGTYDNTKDTTVCFAYNSHATAVRYIHKEHKALYFDPHGVAPAKLLENIIHDMFPKCAIIHNTKVLQGPHGVCTLWALWFCMIMEWTHSTFAEIAASKVDDTYLMCMNSLLWRDSAHNTSVIQPTPCAKKDFKTVFDEMIVKSANVIVDLHRSAQSGMQGVPVSYSILAQNNNNMLGFNRVYDEINKIRNALLQNTSIGDFVKVLDTCNKIVMDNFSNMECGSINMRNMEGSRLPYYTVSAWNNQVSIISNARQAYSELMCKLLKEQLSTFPSTTMI
jgi:hypothetical protein